MTQDTNTASGAAEPNLHTIQAKLIAAQNCHPNAVQTLIVEALDAIDTVARAALASAPTPQADSVQEDAARLDWLLLRISGAEFRRLGVHYSGNARRADVDTARKQGANHD